MANAGLIESPTYISLPAGSDLSTKQFFFMDVTAGKLAVAGAGTRVAGVLADDPAAINRPGQLQIAGVAKVLAAGTITSGAGVASDASGKAVAATGSAFVVGICVNLGTVATGEYAAVLLTPTGAVGQAGDIETVSAAGALNPGVRTTMLSVTGTVAYTLADGSYAGQIKRVQCIVAATTPLGSLTIASPETTAGLACAAVFTFTTVGQAIELLWTGTKWRALRVQRAGKLAAIVAGTDVLTGLNLVNQYIMAVDGTDAGTGTGGLPNGSAPGERCTISCSLANNLPAGSLTGSYVDLLGAAATICGAIGVVASASVVGDIAVLEWNGTAWAAVYQAGVTFS